MDKSMSLEDLYVVLVESLMTQYHVIRDHLASFGINLVTHVDTAAAALTEMESNVPDLVICTMHLPDMTGTDLVTKMRNDESLQYVGFILISSETDERYIDPLRQAGVVAILPKPFVAEQLKYALYSTLNFLEPERISLNNRDVEDLSVLIVDDSQTARHHIIRTLTSLGVETIVEAVNGKEAVELIDNNYYDLIVTDYNMPVMDGKELLRYIREHSNQSSVPVLMVTSEHDEKQLLVVKNLGVSAVCDKPFEITTVRNLIQSIVV